MKDFPDGAPEFGAKFFFGKIFAEDCMKMKEIGPTGGARPWRPLLYANDYVSSTCSGAGRRIGGSRGGGRTRRAPPHLPGILVFDDILGHIV